MRRAVLGVALLLTGCSSGGQTERDPGPPAAAGVAPLVAVQTMPVDIASLPRLRTALPRSLPSDASALPDLMDDPPGRATMVYHPPEMIVDEPVDGWASETLIFYGVDGRWRRMRMDELGLPDAIWPGSDTYGAGSLSPDGRRWVGKSRAGVIVVDLATGHADLIDLGTDWTAWVEWRDDSRTIVVGHRNARFRTDLIELSSRQRTALPFTYWSASFAPDGTAYSLRSAGRGRVELVAWHGDVPTSVGEVDIPGLRRWTGGMYGPDLTEDRFLVGVQKRPYRTIDLVVVGIDDLQAEARLHLAAKQRSRYVDAEWLDPETVLLEAKSGLVAWRPSDGTFLRVTALPDPGNAFANVDVATGLL